MKNKLEKSARWTWIRAIVIGLAALALSGAASSQARPNTGVMLVTRVYPTTALEVTVANHPPVAMPYFEWQPVAGATSYRLQIADNIGFSPIQKEVVIPHTKYLATDLSWLRDTTWYWRVRVETSPSGVGDWPLPETQNQWSFSRNWALNNAPILLSPAAGATIEFFEDPTFSWTPVIGAAGYVIKIDNDFDCQSPIVTYGTPYTHFTPNQRLANANYYWCVLPQDPANRDGQMSEARQLFVNYAQTTTLLEPANNSFPVYTPQFKWTAVKGAYAYQLYYSTDQTFQTNVIGVYVNQPVYTPPASLPNDKDYFWKVRAYYSGGYLGPDSAIWRFQKKWYHKPIVLTPRNNEQTNPPLFTWTPVREAAYYRLDAARDASFVNMYWSITTPNTFYFRTNWAGDEWGKVMYMRVVPIDASGNEGQASLPISYRPVYLTAFPGQQFPRYYYTPPSVPTGNYLPPYNIPTSYDYALSIPTFYWERTFITGSLPGGPRVEASRYRLEVDDNPNFTPPISWTYETANLSATPYDAQPFDPIPTTLLYWRVTALDGAGQVLTSTATTEPWAVKIDTGRLMTPTATVSPALLRPPHNDKVMDTLPSFEWQPMSQANIVRYQIEITTTDPLVTSTVVYTANTVYTHHTPNVRLPKGTYYWHVRGLDAGNQTIGNWSETRRLFVAYQTRWACVNTALLPTNPGTLIASDTNNGLGNYELTTLYSAQDKDNWYVGFNHGTLTGTVTYGLYFDSNQEDETIPNGGATTAPPGRPAVTTSAYFRPEYAIYLTYNGTRFISETIALYRWDKSLPVPDWDPQIKNLVDQIQVGGGFTYSDTAKYVELRIPKTAIGDEGFSPFMLGLALFSTASPTTGSAIDTVPSNGHSTTVLTEFKTIADRPTLSLPGDDRLGADSALPYTPDILAETPDIDWLRGYKLQIARDPIFNSIVATFDSECYGCEAFVDIFQYLVTPQNVQEDNTLYWRYFTKHLHQNNPLPGCGSIVYGPPSDAHVYEKAGPTPQNLRIEGNYSTPTFRWNDVEGAAAYRLQWSQNPDFSGAVSERGTNHNGFTPENPITPGKYYWRVRQENNINGSYASAWSVSTTLVITLPQVSVTQPALGVIVNLPPTFKWSPVLTTSWGSPYVRLQVATSPTGFSNPFEDLVVDTINWTPNRTYPDGTFYWRAAVRDANGNDGPYTQVYTFTKQYMAPTLIAPLSGGRTGDYPEFEWEAVTGAAYYRLMVATNSQFSPSVIDATTTSIHFIPTSKLNTGSYYWRVAMIDRDGRQGPFNDATLIVDPYPYRVYTPLVRK